MRYNAAEWGLAEVFGNCIGNMALLKNLYQFTPSSLTSLRCFHQGAALNQIILLSRLRVVDNSAIGKEAMLEGRPPKVIQVYNKTGVGYLGIIPSSLHKNVFIKN